MGVGGCSQMFERFQRKCTRQNESHLQMEGTSEGKLRKKSGFFSLLFFCFFFRSFTASYMYFELSAVPSQNCYNATIVINHFLHIRPHSRITDTCSSRTLKCDCYMGVSSNSTVKCSSC